MYLSVNSFFSLWTVYIMKLGYITSYITGCMMLRYITGCMMLRYITGYIKGWKGPTY